MPPLLRRYARRQRQRQRHCHIGTVFELDSHEDHLVIADIFQIVNCEFALAYPAVPYLVGLVGPFDRRAILYMRASAAAGNRDPKVIQHVTMEAKALARGKPDDPYAGALILRQQRGANARVAAGCCRASPVNAHFATSATSASSSRYVRYWHLADITTVLIYVRFRG